MRRLLLPLSWLVYGVAQCYKKWTLATPIPTFRVPIIVVGNISMGGTGKTPFVCALVEELKQRGYKPGVVSRGYKGKYSSSTPHIVQQADLAQNTGDEPFLIAQKTQVPVVICKKRPKAVSCLLETFSDIDVVISDDGLQHYRLKRDMEIALVSQKTKPLLFPAGDLREPLSRLKSVDFIIPSQEIKRSLKKCVRLLSTSNVIRSLNSFKGQTVYAVAGLAYPEDFFNNLRQEALSVIACPFKDHICYTQADFNHLLSLSEVHPVLITEKDAVKFKQWTSNSVSNIWVVSLQTQIDPVLIEKIMSHLKGISKNG